MAKIAFTKLGLKANQDVKTIEFNGQTIEVKQYLPIEEKLNLITKIINCSVDENNYYNPCRIDIFKTIFIAETYADITFTAKQKENLYKIYDALCGSGLYAEIYNNIDEKDLNWINRAVEETVQSIYTYKNSVLGILHTIKEDYGNLELDANKIAEIVNDPNQLALLKNIVDKLD